MKKTLLLGALMLAGLCANAQEGGLPDGSIAPDFTATDLNGNTHTLSEYLAEGKTVVLYISATWCGPCWQFHNTHYLEEVYNVYGMGGSEDVVILYVEGDPTTTVAHLNGIGSASKTQGNWVEGTSYPILDNAQIANDYDINAFPTLFRICPEDGTTTQIQRATPYGLMQQIEAGCHEAVGTPNWADINASESKYCGDTGTIRASVTNKGGNIESIRAKLFKGDVEIADQTFTGFDLAPFEPGAFGFDETTLDEAAQYHVELVEVNGVAPYTENAAELTSESFNVIANNPHTTSNNYIKVTVKTDYYPREISWAIYNSVGAEVVSHSYPEGPVDGGGPNANATIEHTLTLPEGTDCYTVVMYDAYGDGWDDNGPENTVTEFGITITSGDNVVYENDGTGNWSVIGEESIFATNGILGAKQFEAGTFSIYPNPSNGIFNIAAEENVSITVIDITGKVVNTTNNISNGGVINLTNLQSGMYIAKIKGDSGAEKVEKLMIK